MAAARSRTGRRLGTQDAGEPFAQLGRAQSACRLGVFGERAAAEEAGADEDRHQEERVADGGLVAGLDELVVARLAEVVPDQLVGGRQAEGGGAQGLGGRLADLADEGVVAAGSPSRRAQTTTARSPCSRLAR